MKILFIEPCYVGFGGYFRAINICTYLSKQKVQATLLVASKKEFQFYIKKTKINEYLTQYELPRFNFHFFFNGRILRGVIGLMFGLVGKYDIIHTCVPVQLETNIPTFFLKLAGKKVVMDWDDYWEGSRIYGEHKIMKMYVKFCEQKMPKFVGSMVVVSEFLKNLAIKRGATNVLKLINGVNTEQVEVKDRADCRKKLKLDFNRKYLLTFGNTFTHDRALLLFTIFKKIYEKDSSIQLLFNLNPYDLIKTEQLDDRINKDDDFLKNIICVGQIPQKSLGDYLSAADATIFLTGNHDNERANFPIRLGTFLAGESIIIMNDVNSEANNTLKRYNCAIIEKDLDTLADETIRLLNDYNLFKELKKNVLVAKKDLTWTKLSMYLIEYYKVVLSQ